MGSRGSDKLEFAAPDSRIFSIIMENPRAQGSEIIIDLPAPPQQPAPAPQPVQQQTAKHPAADAARRQAAGAEERARAAKARRKAEEKAKDEAEAEKARRDAEEKAGVADARRVIEELERTKDLTGEEASQAFSPPRARARSVCAQRTGTRRCAPARCTCSRAGTTPARS